MGLDYKSYSFRLSIKNENEKILYDKLEYVSKHGNISNFIKEALSFYISNGCSAGSNNAPASSHTSEEIEAITKVLVNLTNSTEELYSKIKNLDISVCVPQNMIIDNVDKGKLSSVDADENSSKREKNGSSRAEKNNKKVENSKPVSENTEKPITVEDDTEDTDGVDIIKVSKDTESPIGNDVMSSLLDFLN